MLPFNDRSAIARTLRLDYMTGKSTNKEEFASFLLKVAVTDAHTSSKSAPRLTQVKNHRLALHYLYLTVQLD